MIAIAIDGPAGAGKSTIAQAIAQTLEYIYVDTGALYRAVGLFVVRHGADTTNEEQVVSLLPEIDVQLQFADGVQQVLLNGENVTNRLRTPEISMAASNVSALPAVRTFLFDLQRNLAKQHNVVMDGRDIGTVVLPDAQIKLFLTATPEERARRRYEELLESGVAADYEEVLADVKKRDYNDSHREIAPLKQAEDAILFNTTGNELSTSITLLTDYVKERLRDVL